MTLVCNVLQSSICTDKASGLVFWLASFQVLLTAGNLVKSLGQTRQLITFCSSPLLSMSFMVAACAEKYKRSEPMSKTVRAMDGDAAKLKGVNTSDEICVAARRPDCRSCFPAETWHSGISA